MGRDHTIVPLRQQGDQVRNDEGVATSGAVRAGVGRHSLAAWLSGAALGFSLLHVGWDLLVNRYFVAQGVTERLVAGAPAQPALFALTAAMVALVYVLWIQALQLRNRTDGIAALVLTTVWAALLNGLAGVLTRAPGMAWPDAPLSTLPPTIVVLEDLGHLGSLVFGVAGGVALAVAVRSMGAVVVAWRRVALVVVPVAGFIASGVLALAGL